MSSLAGHEADSGSTRTGAASDRVRGLALSPRFSKVAALLSFLLALAVVLPRGSAGQTGERGAIRAGGAALGAYSGATLGLVGSLVPCNRVLSGRRCVRVVTAVAAAGGLVSGTVLSIRDESRIHDRLRGSGYGALAGAVVGLGLRNFVRQYDWADVAAASAVGAAIGASAVGAGVGFAMGAVPGLLLWKGLGAIDTSDAVALSLAGLALGGLVGWAVAAGRDPNPGPVPLQIRIPLPTPSF